MLRGAFRLPIPERRRVREGEAPVGVPLAQAVLPVSLVLTGDDLPGPYQLDLQVPVFEAPSGEPAVGHFALDLTEHLALPAQRTHAYVFSGAAMTGPVSFELKEG